MTHVMPRLARFAAFFLVGALVMAPLSASAAPTGAVPGDDRAAASYRAKNEDEAAKNAKEEAETAAKEAERAAMEAACEEEQAAEKAPREDKKDKKEKASKKDKKEKAAEKAACEDEKASKKDKKEKAAEKAARDEEKAAGKTARDEEKAAEKAGCEEEKSSKKDKKENAAGKAGCEEEKAAEEDPVGAVTGPGGASPSLAPVGATPAEGEVVSIDEVLVPTHLSAAMELFDQQAEASNSIPEPVAPPMGMVSGTLARELAPVLPPLLADAVAAPFVVIEALIDAMAASGQALVIPLLAGATGFIAPLVRRKHLLGEALGENPEPVPSNEPRIVFFGW